MQAGWARGCRVAVDMQFAVLLALRAVGMRFASLFAEQQTQEYSVDQLMFTGCGPAADQHVIPDVDCKHGKVWTAVIACMQAAAGIGNPHAACTRLFAWPFSRDTLSVWRACCWDMPDFLRDSSCLATISSNLRASQGCMAGGTVLVVHGVAGSTRDR